MSGEPILIQPLIGVGEGKIHFVGDVRIGYFPSPFFLSTHAYLDVRNKAASITIDDGTRINNNFCAIVEHTSITIGKRALIGFNVEILDSDFHGIEIAERRISRPTAAKPVIIEDDVFIGNNVRILKGVVIGRGSVVANGSVVAKDIPPDVIVGGNPARVLKSIGAAPEMIPSASRRTP